MVREQEPARNPLVPAQARAASQPTSDDKIQSIDLTSSPQTRQPTASLLMSPQPVFGQATDLSLNASPLAKSSTRSSASEPQKVKKSASRPDGSYNNLFSTRPEPAKYHKPPSSSNPLSQLGKVSQTQLPSEDIKYAQPVRSNTYGLTNAGYGSENQTAGRPVTTKRNDDDVFVVPKPANFPAPQWRAPRPQTFSSGISTNTFFQPRQEFVDLTRSAPPRPDAGEGFDDRQVFGNDRFGTADPFTYLDTRQADENIKALLEGAMDEEDDKPRTRRKKKETEAKVDDLTKRMQGATVGEADTRDEDDEEEEEEDDDDGTREGLKVRLLPHQIEGVEWMRNKELGTKKVKGILPKGGILADDMGLGKTIQSIALILSNQKPSTEELEKTKRKLDPKTDRSTLVVAPLALIKQWEGEIKDRVEEEHALKVLVHHGPQRSKSYKDLRKYDVVITTYQTVSSEFADGSDTLKSALFGVNWYRVILDEAHSIKNRNAKSTKAACGLNAEYRWCLTGTPMQNNLDELQSLIHFLRIKPYDNLEVWRDQITKPMNNGHGGLSIRRLRAFLSAFMKRRTKDVLKQDDKPDVEGKAQKSKNGFKIVNRTIEKVEAEFNEEERAFYDRLEARTDRSLELMMAGNQMSYANALVLLMRLRQACNHPKLLGHDLAKETEPLNRSRTPSRKANKADDMDEIANMLGGLSVATKRCDICQIELSKEAVEDGMIRCDECEEDLQQQEQSAKKPRSKKKEKIHVKKERKTNRRLVLDSDDEDGSVQQVESETEAEEEEEAYTSDEEDALTPDIASSTKIRHLLKILTHDSSTHKYIIFSFFTSMLDLIEPFLHAASIPFARYDGKMRNDHREAALETLRTNPTTRVLLCSLRAGSLGLNLTAASRVVILEPFWNPFVEEQAIDRVHRLNQTQDVVVHKLTIRDTVEARILELQEKKRELAKATIEGQKGAGAGKLNMAEMLKLFRHDAERDAKLDMIGMKGRGVLEKGETTAESTFTLEGEAALMAGVVSSRPDSRTSDRYGNKGPGKREDPVYGRRW